MTPVWAPYHELALARQGNHKNNLDGYRYIVQTLRV